jgi:hypothetical protein
MLIIILNCSHIRNIIKYFLNNKIKSKSRSIIFMSADFYSLEMDSSNYLPLIRSMDSPGQSVLLKSVKFEMGLGRLAPALDVAEGHTLLF